MSSPFEHYSQGSTHTHDYSSEASIHTHTHEYTSIHEEGCGYSLFQLLAPGRRGATERPSLPRPGNDE